jgi:hypothetical protein
MERKKSVRERVRGLRTREGKGGGRPRAEGRRQSSCKRLGTDVGAAYMVAEEDDPREVSIDRDTDGDDGRLNDAWTAQQGEGERFRSSFFFTMGKPTCMYEAIYRV